MCKLRKGSGRLKRTADGCLSEVCVLLYVFCCVLLEGARTVLSRDLTQKMVRMENQPARWDRTTFSVNIFFFFLFFFFFFFKRLGFRDPPAPPPPPPLVRLQIVLRSSAPVGFSILTIFDVRCMMSQSPGTLVSLAEKMVSLSMYHYYFIIMDIIASCILLFMLTPTSCI